MNANLREFTWCWICGPVPVGSPPLNDCAFGINDTGEIVGFGVQLTTGELHAFSARPIGGGSPE